MSWNRFAYIFTKQVENAMRYSIHEALRRQCQSAGGGTSEGIADDAIETFKRKMERNAPGNGCDKAFEMAQQMAANLGYVLVPEPQHPDSPQS